MHVCKWREGNVPPLVTGLLVPAVEDDRAPSEGEAAPIACCFDFFLKFVQVVRI